MKKTITLLAVIIMVIITSMSNSFGQTLWVFESADVSVARINIIYLNDVGGNKADNPLTIDHYYTDTTYTNEEILSYTYIYFDYYNNKYTVSSIDTTTKQDVYKITFTTSYPENTQNPGPFKIFFKFNVKESTTSTKDINVSNLTLYPNPVSNVLNINFDATEDVDVTVMDMSGRVLYTETTSMLTSVDMSDQPSGMYLVKVGNEMIKVVKQ